MSKLECFLFLCFLDKRIKCDILISKLLSFFKFAVIKKSESKFILIEIRIVESTLSMNMLPPK